METPDWCIEAAKEFSAATGDYKMRISLLATIIHEHHKKEMGPRYQKLAYALGQTCKDTDGNLWPDPNFLATLRAGRWENTENPLLRRLYQMMNLEHELGVPCGTEEWEKLRVDVEQNILGNPNGHH
jgi:hypothetical protein